MAARLIKLARLNGAVEFPGARSANVLRAEGDHGEKLVMSWDLDGLHVFDKNGDEHIIPASNVRQLSVLTTAKDPKK